MWAYFDCNWHYSSRVRMEDEALAVRGGLDAREIIAALGQQVTR
jgi:hypothetical protein